VSISERLVFFRKAYDLTTTQMANVLHVSSQTYHLYEKGQRGLTTSACERLHKMGCDLNWLIAGENDEWVRNNPFNGGRVGKYDGESGIDGIKKLIDDGLEQTAMEQIAKEINDTKQEFIIKWNKLDELCKTIQQKTKN